jgi:periplasmic protein TonB
MFEQSLVETSLENRKRKRWTAMASYSLEALAVLAVMIFPLVHTEALPLEDYELKFHPPTRFVPPHVKIANPRPQIERRTRAVAINPYLAPQQIPKHVDSTPDPTPPGPIADGPQIPGAIPGGPGDGPGNPVLESMLRSPVIPTMHRAPSLVQRTSRSQESLLLRQVKPVYPRIAITSRVQGAVVIQAVISRNGAIEKLQLISGHPLLVDAALDAVKQWRYRPYLLNGEAVEVETQITVNFTLNGN